MPQNHLQKALLRAAGSTAVSLGNSAREVRVLPNFTFTRDLALMAQPLAFRTGPRSRLRSLRQAMNMDGPEMSSRIPTITSSNSQNLREAAPLITATRNWPIKPMAMPMAAKIPANLAMSKEEETALAASLPSPSGLAEVAVSAFSIKPDMDFSFFAAAFLSILSLIMRATFLYGDQKAWRTEMGLSTMAMTLAV